MQHPPSGNVTDQVLRLLRQHGWNTGYQKLSKPPSAAGDAAAQAVHELFLGWRALESGFHAEAESHFRRVAAPAAIAAWAATGLGFASLRSRKLNHLEEAVGHFQRAGELAPVEDQELAAVIEHGLGTVAYRQGNAELARRHLGAALGRLPDGHFQVPRIYDTLGMTWSDTGNFFIASEFFRKSLELKEQPRDGQIDEQGIAVTCGQLGRLHLSWGLLDQAEEYFKQDLEFVERHADDRHRALVYNHLGQIAIRRYETFAPAKRGHDRARHLDCALGWLESCIDLANSAGPPSAAGAFGLKDRALALLYLGRIDDAWQDLQAAEAAFKGLGAEHGLAHVDLIKGQCLRMQSEFEGSLAHLRRAALHIDRAGPVEHAMALLEAARTRRAAGQPRPLVIRAFQQAIEAAESTRRGWLVDFVETEIEQFDPLWMAKRVQERLRGRQVKAPTTSLVAAERETGSVLYLDMQESTSFARARDPEYVLMVVNQLLGGLADEVNSFGGQISSYRGDGFMALWRGMDHPRRAVEASLALVNCTEQFNQPLRQLGHKPIEVRIGIATGELCFGNIGTYEKMDYTAIGATANLGARLESIAEPGKPCLSAATREAVGELFEFTAAAPQWVELKGMGRQACWHLLKRSDEPPMAR